MLPLLPRLLLSAGSGHGSFLPEEGNEEVVFLPFGKGALGFKPLVLSELSSFSLNLAKIYL